MSDTERPYLILFNLATPQPEHVHIKTVLDAVSNGNYKNIYFDRHGGAIVFKTKLKAHQVADRLSTVLLGDDRHLIIELGQDYYTWGLNVAAGWLKHHL